MAIHFNFNLNVLDFIIYFQKSLNFLHFIIDFQKYYHNLSFFNQVLMFLAFFITLLWNSISNYSWLKFLQQVLSFNHHLVKELEVKEQTFHQLIKIIMRLLKEYTNIRVEDILPFLILDLIKVTIRKLNPIFRDSLRIILFKIH